MGFTDRLQHAWNAFKGDDRQQIQHHTASYAYRPDRRSMTAFNGQTIVSSIYTRIAIDVASLTFVHARLDKDNDMFSGSIKSHLNECLTVEANLDQSNWDFMIDLVTSILDEGCVAVVPVDTTINPSLGSYDINTMRVGKVMAWMPEHVRVRLYNESEMAYEEITVPKRSTAIITNPFYDVMNEPNSTLQRLVRKLSILDYVDEQSGAGKLDMIIQLPYVVKSEAREKQAAKRKESIEKQLTDSKYGIAYIDATERITQLNRPVDNNLLANIESLTKTLYNQLGMTEAVFDGSANEQQMLNYYNQTINPIATAITREMIRKFLTKTARSQRQTIMYMRDPFKLVPVNQIADIADKFTRNEILTGNELRGIIGFRPSSDPGADELRNKNLNKQADPTMMQEASEEATEPGMDESGQPLSLENFIDSL